MIIYTMKAGFLESYQLTSGRQPILEIILRFQQATHILLHMLVLMAVLLLFIMCDYGGLVYAGNKI